jgi:hypothetical protein
MGTRDDGSKQNVTDSITWRSSAPSLATADHHGLVSALAIGRPTITANSDNVKASTTLIVLGNASADVPPFAFVANMADSTLSAFTVNPASGQLRHSGYQLVGSLPASVAVDPRGKFVYVADSNDSSISAFVIDSSGNLASVPGSPFKDIANPVALVVDASGDFLYFSKLRLRKRRRILDRCFLWSSYPACRFPFRRRRKSRDPGPSIPP